MSHLIEVYDLGERYMVSGIKKRVIDEFQMRLKEAKSTDVFFSALEIADSYEGIQNAMVKTIKKCMTVENCIDIAEYAYQHGLESLYQSASKFISKNRISIFGQVHLLLDQYDITFVNHLMKSALFENQSNLAQNQSNYTPLTMNDLIHPPIIY